MKYKITLETEVEAENLKEAEEKALYEIWLKGAENCVVEVSE